MSGAGAAAGAAAAGANLDDPTAAGTGTDALWSSCTNETMGENGAIRGVTVDGVVREGRPRLLDTDWLALGMGLAHADATAAGTLDLAASTGAMTAATGGATGSGSVSTFGGDTAVDAVCESPCCTGATTQSQTGYEQR